MLERLLSIPIQQLEALVAESWSALRGVSAYGGVPAPEPSLGLVGEALLDRTFTLYTSFMTGVPLPETVRRMVSEATEARDFYRARGWLDDPAGYHDDPTVPEEWVATDEATWSGPRRRHYRHVAFESGWTPHEGEPARQRWIDHPSNGISHVYLLEHEEPRPWLVCVHGFAMGSPLVNFSGFPVKHLFDTLGLNLAFPVLPLHGPRGAGRVSGAEVLNPDYLRMVHLFAQAAWDVRRTVKWLRANDAERVGLYGISLGAYVAALTATLEDDLACVIAGIPAADFPQLARDNQPWVMRRYDDEFQIDWQLIREISHPVSPLAMPARPPRERRFIYGGIADRVVRPDQPRALWRHWEEPEIHWFSGGHVLGVMNAGVGPFLERSLVRSGLSAAA